MLLDDFGKLQLPLGRKEYKQKTKGSAVPSPSAKETRKLEAGVHWDRQWEVLDRFPKARELA